MKERCLQDSLTSERILCHRDPNAEWEYTISSGCTSSRKRVSSGRKYDLPTYTPNRCLVALKALCESTVSLDNTIDFILLMLRKLRSSSMQMKGRLNRKGTTETS